MPDHTEPSSTDGAKPRAQAPGAPSGPPDRPIFELEPLAEQAPPAPKPPVSARPPEQVSPPPAAPVPPARKGLLGSLGGMLEGFDDDADFDRDPEVETALGIRRDSAPGPASAAGPARPSLVKAGFGTPAVWSAAGTVLLLGAVVGAAVNEKDHPVVAAMLAVYNAGLHTCTGVAALGVAAMLLRRPLGPIDEAAARMYAAVSAFLVLSNLRISLVGQTSWEELTLGAAAYVGVVALLLRLWKRPLVYVACLHFFLWMAVQVGMQLSAWMASKP